MQSGFNRKATVGGVDGSSSHVLPEISGVISKATYKVNVDEWLLSVSDLIFLWKSMVPS